jgi:glycosyltransferase involved in cell wall biosynthesis
MIARDNERTIGAALETIRKYVDDIVVVDTGSKDRTPEIAVGLGARVFHFDWCDDFSAARNESIRHALGEWVFWMDTDDVIDEENAGKIRELVKAVGNWQ